MANRRLVIRDFPEETTKDELMIHFQSRKKSGGGDIRDIQLKEGQAEILFEEEGVDQRVFDHPEHSFNGKILEVSLVTARRKESKKNEKEQDEGILESGTLLVKSAYSPGPSPKGPVTNPICHSADTTDRAIRQCSPKPKTQEEASSTVRVSGFTRQASKDSLLNYFENRRRSQGGAVVDVQINPEENMALVSFETAADAERVVDFKQHVLDKQCIAVSFLEEEGPESIDEVENHDARDSNAEDPEPERCLNFYASGFKPHTTEDTVRHYFENARRSGGGEIEELNFFPEDSAAELIFQEVADYDRLVSREHRIDGQILTIELQEPEEELPLDPRKLYVEELNPKTSSDCLKFYMEKFSMSVEVEDIQFGCNKNALVTFESEPDFDHIMDKVNNSTKGLESFMIRVRRAPICCSVLVAGLSKNTTEETLQLYLEHRKSGGGEVSRVDFKEGRESAVVYFKEPAATESVLQKTGHTLDSMALTLTLYHPLLEEREQERDQVKRRGRTTKVQRKMQMDHDIFAYIEMSHQEELGDLLRQLDATIASDETTNTVVISPMDPGGNCTKPWPEREQAIETFLKGFTKTSIEISFSNDVATEVQKQMHEIPLFTDNDWVKTTFVDPASSVQFIGRNADTCEAMNEFQKLVKMVEEDLHVKRSITENIDQDIPREKLQLLEMSGFCQSLEMESKQLHISVDVVNSRLIFKGLDGEIRDAKTDILKFLVKTKELATELPERCLKVLFSPKGKSFIHKSFQEQNISAILLPGQRRSTNEGMIFGLSIEHARKADKFIHSAVQEFSLPLQEGNVQVISGGKWKEFLAQVMSRCIVEVSFDSNTLWVTGVSNDASQCFQQVKNFLKENTILRELISIPTGSSRFLLNFLGEEVEKITRKYAVECKESDEEGIEISGSAENSTKCIDEIQNLISSVQFESLSIDKPGMGKFFCKGSGATLLRGVEQEHHCVIERKDTTELGEDPFFEEDSIVDGERGVECICSFVTPRGKKIAVFKDDLTKHQADVIVNAANDKLNHIGGLAAAILKAGGNEIQEECNAFVQTRGKLLEGQIFVSKSGKLPCKRIIHAVGPIWDQKAKKEHSDEKKTRQEGILEYAISNCLKEARSLSSIAIPAVSSGVYGFPLDLCAKVIIGAVTEFFKENPTCQLSEVHLTNIKDATVAQFADEMRTRFGKEETFHDYAKQAASTSTSKSRFSSARGGRNRNKQYSLTTAEGVNISVRAGDLAKEQAHVLVGTCGSDLNLDQNPCAKALSQAAGPGLQLECSTKGKVKGGDIAEVGPGALNCRAVYFAVCSPWNGGKGEKLLIGLFKKCLTQAHLNKVASIAFSSIGTGVLKFPCNAVARVYFEQAMKFSKRYPNTTLKDIRFIPFDKDIATVKAFTEELSNRTSGISEVSASPKVTSRQQPTSQVEPPIFSAVKERTIDHLEINVGSLSFQVQAGDITQETTDAIVIVSNTELDLSMGGGAGAAILRKGGGSIQDECSKLGIQSAGSVVVTGAGGLGTNYIFHIVPPQPMTQSTLKAVLVKCLQTAEMNKIRSISFPAIGTGNLGMDAKDCAEVLLASVERFSQQNLKFIQLVRITIFQSHMIDAFRSVMKVKSGVKEANEPGILARMGRKVAGYFPFLGGEQETNLEDGSAISRAVKISLEVFAGSRKDLRGAIKAIKDLMNEHCKQRVVDNEAIKMLSEEQERRIHTAELRYDTKVQIERKVGRIEVRGRSEDILEVTSQIHEILHEIKEEERERDRAEQLAKEIEWEYKFGEEFKQYPSDINFKIETAYTAKKSLVTFIIEEVLCTIDFTSMVEKNDDNVMDVRRRDYTKDFAVPSNWDAQPTDASGREKEVHLVKLDPMMAEYKNVEQNLQSSLTAIVNIERVQNPGLWGIYAVKKAKMDEGKGSNEKWLFHGTAGVNVPAINSKGFNRSYAGINAAMHGNGVYFAVDASYSARSTYSPPDITGMRYMYLARVLVGEYTLGKQGIIVPPNKQNDPSDSFDTVVDQIPNPAIFVAFYDWQYYPEYLITFQ